jgi:predicted extracellular nuclease
MNTLNFFLTLDYPTGNPLDNKCGPGQNVECRGADADQPAEFQRQRDKLLAAIASIGGDVIGLNEIENTPGVEPLGDPTNGIVAGLNAVEGAGSYAFVDTGVIGTDAIRVGMIYKPAKVAPVGTFATLDSTDDPRFIDTKNRPSLAQTFEVLSSGARFTVVVNHLKSKGSDCLDVADPDTGDGQGNCNATRTAAAAALMDWIATDPTGSGDTDVLVVGDLNSYAKEDPVTTIRQGADDTSGTLDDFTNLVDKYQGAGAYSYVFDAQVGYLDHALGSASLTAQVDGAAEFHINADEPDVIDYDTTFKPPQQDALYAPDGFRASDHDPVVVGLAPLHYPFSGFHKLAFDSAAFNTATGGSSVPLKFSLGGDQGQDIFVPGYPLSFPIACDGSGAALGPAVSTVNPGNSALSFDPLTGQYTYVWKTKRAWRGTCRRLVVVLKDGAVHYANMMFK